MSDHVLTPASTAAHAATGHAAGHEDPMSHVPPGSIWPLILTLGLMLVPFGALSVLGAMKGSGWGVGPINLENPLIGKVLLGIGGLVFIFSLMAWCHQIIREKLISHDLIKQQKDLQMFVLLFLCGEFTAFSAIFGFFYHRKIMDPLFGPIHDPTFHFGGPIVAYATFILLFSSVTCEFAHHALQSHKVGLAKLLFTLTILLGVAFLGFQGFEWGELLQRGFTPISITEGSASSFAAIFYTGTGFHGLHVSIGLVMLFMVLFRLEVGHFRGKRHFSVVAASWYWHFVDIVWVLLFITIYVVG
ncbi:MAG: heme-copper oxidase subunit III [Planctomycetes bacterium]|nr:heme-copper oxidase subunit III [Planctomycetota bacterium]